MRLTCDPCSWALGVSWRDFVECRDLAGKLVAVTSQDGFQWTAMLAGVPITGRVCLAFKVQLACIVIGFAVPTCVVLTVESDQQAGQRELREVGEELSRRNKA